MTTTRVQNPQTTRQGYSINSESANAIGADVPPSVKARPTPQGAMPVGRPTPTAGTPQSKIAKGTNSAEVYQTSAPYSEGQPPRTQHKTTEEQLASGSDFYAPHAASFSDLSGLVEQLVQAHQLDNSPSAEIRRLVASARAGNVRSYDVLRGLTFGWQSGLATGADMERQRAARPTATRDSSATGGVTSHSPRPARPHNPAAENAQRAILATFRRMTEDQWLLEQQQALVGVAMTATPQLQTRRQAFS